ncbi:MAG TPA: ABC transporter ATP-binding protein [Ignavibacteria bacterium]|nr:ABC transporter ATP-binding protein [Ignavibacteria bacterium]
MSKLLELENISFSYASKNKIKPANNFLISETSLHIETGDFISIIGKNGSGKSTLVKLISKILVGYKGNIFYKGKEIHSIERKEYSRSISYLPQISASVNDDLTVFEFLLLGRYSHKAFTDFRNTVEDRKVVEYCIKESGIEKFSNKYLYELSGGERQKVLLTLGLVQLDISQDLHEKVMIIDEPLTYLDVKYQLEIFKVLKDLNIKGLTIIIVIHDLGLALNYTSKTILMNSGKMAMYSESGKVITEEVLKEHFLIDSEIINYGNSYLINYSLQNKNMKFSNE